MGRVWKLLALGFVVILIIIQFLQPERNNTPADPDLDMLSLLSPPEATAELIRKACYDCHSNQTAYPWYSSIAPLSWYLNRHILKGKEELNFSAFGELEKTDKIGAFADFCDVLDAGNMPLPSYRLIHKEARLSDEERALLCQWSEGEALKAMRE